MYERDIYEGEDKAGYNQSRGITEFLSSLLGSYIIHMNMEQYDKAIGAIERIVDVISAKLKDEEIKKVDRMLFVIQKELPLAMASYVSNGMKFWKDGESRKIIKRHITILFRYVNKLQDKHGYGMVSQDDPRMAVLKR